MTQLRAKIDATMKQIADQETSFASEANRLQAQIDDLKQALAFVQAHPETETIARIIAKVTS